MTRVYQTLVLPILTLCLCDLVTLLAADIKELETFHMKYQRHVDKIRWQDHVRNTDVSSVTGLSPVLDPIVCRRSSLSGHVARLPEDTPAHQALWCRIDLSLGRLPDSSWRRCPGQTFSKLNKSGISRDESPVRRWVTLACILVNWIIQLSQVSLCVMSLSAASQILNIPVIQRPD